MTTRAPAVLKINKNIHMLCDHNNMLNIDYHKISQLPPSGADGEGETGGAVSHQGASFTGETF